MASGTGAALLIAALALLFLNPEECPADYSQAEVDASNCIIGANIGLGLALLSAVGLWVATIALAVGIMIRDRLRDTR